MPGDTSVKYGSRDVSINTYRMKSYDLYRRLLGYVSGDVLVNDAGKRQELPM